MLDQVLAGNPVTLGLAAWLAYGPAVIVAIVAMLVMARRQPPPAVMRRRRIAALILAVVAMALAYYGTRPQVVIAADSLTCRPWTRPVLLSEIADYYAGGEPSPWEGPPAFAFGVRRASAMPPGGVVTRVEEVAVSILRGDSPLHLDAVEPGRAGGVCSLGGLAIGGEEAVGLIEVALGRSRLGRNLPDLDSPQAIESWCANPPQGFIGRCSELVRLLKSDCEEPDRAVPAAAILGCRYRFALIRARYPPGS
jgi:hypothetical protein